MMTKLLKVGMVITVLASLAGCIGHGRGKYNQQNYWKHAQVISPVVVPSDIRVKPSLGFYPAPPHIDVSGDTSPPSLIPPGSKVEYYQSMRHLKKGRA